MAEPRVVRSDEVIPAGEAGEQRLEHPRRRGQTVQEKERRGVLLPCLSIEDRESIHLDRAILRRMPHGMILGAGYLNVAIAVCSDAQRATDMQTAREMRRSTLGSN